MVAEVLAFAMVLVAFEFVLLCMVPPRMRLRLLGNEGAKVAVHLIMLLINMYVHWGTVVGTMSATLSFVTSLLTLYCAKLLFGAITENRYYKVGLIKYSVAELR